MNILGLIDSDEATSFPADSLIFREGDPGEVMYLVRSGEVEIIVSGKTIDVAEAGSPVGEMALIDAQPRSASALARTACELIPIDRSRFLALVQEDPEFAMSVMTVLARRLRAMDGHT